MRFRSKSAGSEKVLVKVGVSFVSAAGATANLHAEDPGWNFQQTSPRAATAEWNGAARAASRSRVGHEPLQRIFYTALYHSLLFPSVFSDDDGRYMGFDHQVHRLPAGQVQYSNISECDIYRTEVPLLALLLPGPTSQMVQSLLRRRRADQGRLTYPSGSSPTTTPASGTGTRSTRSSPTPMPMGHASSMLRDALAP